MDNQEKKRLLQVTNLKQYFPVGKDAFVKANDGISLDIYEGETFGLVGESGCGKSTLGRSILQMYRQTDGRTMYFGRTLDEIAPRYAYETYRSLSRRRGELEEKQARYAAFRKSYGEKGEQEQYALHGELTRLAKEANDAMLDVATLIGGLFAAPDLEPVEAACLRQYAVSRELRKAREGRAEAQLDADGAADALKKAEEAGRDTASLRRKLGKAKETLRLWDEKIGRIRDRIAAAHEELESMRGICRNQPDFERYERWRSNGIDLARLTHGEMRGLRKDLQLIFQDPYSSLNARMTVGQIIGEGMIAHKFFRRNDDRMKEKIISVMEECGLSAYFLHRYPHQFSGGQRQRIGIARSLALRPKFVVCDEAVSALDVSIQAQIINLLRDLKEKQNLTYLFITHDLSVVKYISDRIGVMYLGSMVETAASDDLFAHPLHPYTAALLNAIPTTDENARSDPEILEGDIPSPVNPPRGCKFHTRCKYCTEICTQVAPQMREVRPNHFAACHHVLEESRG